MKILRTTDIITLKNNGIEVDFSPLRHDRALELGKLVRIEAGKTVADTETQTALLIKYSVKEVRGVKDLLGEEIVIKAENGELSDDDVSNTVNVLIRTPFIGPVAYIANAAALPKKLDGVEVYMKNKEGKQVKIELGN